MSQKTQSKNLLYLSFFEFLIQLHLFPQFLTSFFFEKDTQTDEILLSNNITDYVDEISVEILKADQYYVVNSNAFDKQILCDSITLSCPDIHGSYKRTKTHAEYDAMSITMERDIARSIYVIKIVFPNSSTKIIAANKGTIRYPHNIHKYIVSQTYDRYDTTVTKK